MARGKRAKKYIRIGIKNVLFGPASSYFAICLFLTQWKNIVAIKVYSV